MIGKEVEQAWPILRERQREDRPFLGMVCELPWRRPAEGCKGNEAEDREGPPLAKKRQLPAGVAPGLLGDQIHRRTCGS